FGLNVYTSKITGFSFFFYRSFERYSPCLRTGFFPHFLSFLSSIFSSRPFSFPSIFRCTILFSRHRVQTSIAHDSPSSLLPHISYPTYFARIICSSDNSFKHRLHLYSHPRI